MLKAEHIKHFRAVSAKKALFYEYFYKEGDFYNEKI